MLLGPSNFQVAWDSSFFQPSCSKYAPSAKNRSRSWADDTPRQEDEPFAKQREADGSKLSMKGFCYWFALAAFSRLICVKKVEELREEVRLLKEQLKKSSRLDSQAIGEIRAKTEYMSPCHEPCVSSRWLALFALLKHISAKECALFFCKPYPQCD